MAAGGGDRRPWRRGGSGAGRRRRPRPTVHVRSIRPPACRLPRPFPVRNTGCDRSPPDNTTSSKTAWRSSPATTPKQSKKRSITPWPSGPGPAGVVGLRRRLGHGPRSAQVRRRDGRLRRARPGHPRSGREVRSPRTSSDPRIHVIAQRRPAVRQRTAARYDVVILDVPDPSTSQLNRFYTREFFAEVRRILVPGGVVSFGLGHGTKAIWAMRWPGCWPSPTARWPRVSITCWWCPGGEVFFLASDGPLTSDIAATAPAGPA